VATGGAAAATKADMPPKLTCPEAYAGAAGDGGTAFPGISVVDETAKAADIDCGGATPAALAAAIPQGATDVSQAITCSVRDAQGQSAERTFAAKMSAPLRVQPAFGLQAGHGAAACWFEPQSC
jgi:hypothetical protein